MRFSSLFAAPFLLFAASASAPAAGLQQIASIPIPGAPMKVFGAMFVDPTAHRAFLADRSNKAIDVIDTDANKYLTRIGGFVGVGATGSTSGPQGVVAVNDGAQVWATNGDSSVKVIDLATGKIVDSIATGGKNRTGEVAYDERDHIVLATNPDETTQFVTLISTEPGRRILAKIPFPDATEGIERPAYSPQTGRFYVPLPSLDKARAAGGVAEIDPRQAKLIAVHPTDHCNPHSVAVVSSSRLFIGCNFGAADSRGPKGQLVTFELPLGNIAQTGASLGGDGQTALDLTVGQYYAAANKNPGGPVLKVVDVRTLRPVEMIHTWTGSHTVAVDTGSHRIYIPAAAGAAPCGGCVMVYASGQ